MKKIYEMVATVIGIIIIINSFVQPNVLAATQNTPVDIKIPYFANGNDVITFSDGTDNDITTNTENRTVMLDGEVEITFTEPGTYSYSMSDENTTYDIEINVYTDDNGVLTSAVSVYDADGAKVSEIDFYDDVYVDVNIVVVGNGNATGSGSYRHGSNVNLTATSTEGNRFVEWRDSNGNTLSTNSTWSLTADASLLDEITVYAVFERNSATATPTITAVPTNTPSNTTAPTTDSNNTTETSPDSAVSTGEKMSIFVISAMICLSLSAVAINGYMKVKNDEE